VGTWTLVRLVLVVLLTTLAVLLALWLLYQPLAIVVWGILAPFLAVALNPAVNSLAGRRVPRAVAILLTYLGVLVVVAESPLWPRPRCTCRRRRWSTRSSSRAG
jgi:predicted PurR-regulated permease PerM